MAVESFKIDFHNGHVAQAVRLEAEADPKEALSALNLHMGHPTIVIMGGAGAMETEQMQRLQHLIDHGLTKFAEETGIAIVDGGTQAGVMALIGGSRLWHGYTFPLIGVAPEALIQYPLFANPNAAAELDHGHSHFVLTSGTHWGDESEMLAGIGAELAQKEHHKVLGLVINGGSVVKAEAHARATSALQFPQAFFEGSGRFADEVATALRAQTSEDPVIQEIVKAPQSMIIPSGITADELRAWLEAYFAQ